MASLNKVMLIGNAGKDAELRYMANGNAQAQFSVAVNHNKRNPKTNEWESETEWFNVVMWGDQAERQSQYIAKGTQVYVEGRLQTRSWEDDKGEKHYRTEVVANHVQTLGKREGGEKPYTRGGDFEADDLPFE